MEHKDKYGHMSNNEMLARMLLNQKILHTLYRNETNPETLAKLKEQDEQIATVLHRIQQSNAPLQDQRMKSRLL